MAVNRTKVLEAAQKFQSKGQYDKAIAEYQKLVVEDPRDVRTLLKIGDLHTRRNKPKDAIEVYEKVAELYAKQGFFLKGVAVYKQILKLDPNHVSATLKLAQMYEELALASDALSTYEQAADAFLAQGQVNKALDTMEKMIALDGQNVAARIKYAEALSKADRPREAASAFADGARLLREQGRIDDYIRVIERQLYHDPDNVEIARELSGRYLERSDPKRALAKLQVCFKADPRDVQTLEMLAEAFRQLGQIPKTISVLKEIARLHGEVHADEPRRRTLLRVLDLDPTDAEAKQALATTGVAVKAPAAAAPAAARPAPAQPRAPEPQPAPQLREPDHDDVFIEEPEDPTQQDDELSLLDAEGEAERDELHEDSGAQLLIAETSIAEPPPSGSQTTSISGLLVAAEGYESNEDYYQAEEALLHALELDRDNLEVHERLKDMYLATDRRVEAVRELLWLSDEATERDLAQARRYARAAFELAPNAAATRSRLTALGVDVDTGDVLGGAGRPRPSAEEVVFVDDSAEAGGEVDDLLEPSEQDQSFGAPSADAPPRSDRFHGVPGSEAPPRSDYLSPQPQTFGSTLSQTGPQRPSARAASSSSEAEVDPLEIPLRPDEFEGGMRHLGSLPPARPELASLLDRPFLPEEFEASFGPDGLMQTGAEDEGLPEPLPDVAALLDAPISPDEFDAGPPIRRERAAAFPRAREPIDDFGLSDARFDRSDLHEVTHTPEAPVFPEPADDPWLARRDASDAFAELSASDLEQSRLAGDAGQTMRPGGPGPIDSAGSPALTRPASIDPAGELDDEVPELDDDLLISAEDEGAPAAEFAGLDAVEQDYDEDGDFSGEIPEPTVPAQPIPELIRRSSQDELEPIQIAAAPSAEASLPPAPVAAAPAAPLPFRPSLPAPLPAPEVEAPEVLTPEIEEALDEADFFASQGMLDEALEVVQEAILIYPYSSALKKRFQEYVDAAEARDAAPAAKEEDHSFDDESFDIAEQLASVEMPAAAADDEMVDVESVFAQFKKGVAQQIAVDDTDTHFDLGIAYKEMGLLDDAISEFELSSKSPQRACTALTMVGMCHMEKGDPLKAVTYFERALAQNVPSAAEEMALWYEIGSAQEASGQVEKALAAFEKVAARDRTFRGVSARMEQLKRRAGGAPGASRVSR